jgi:hypothetical protein
MNTLIVVKNASKVREGLPVIELVCGKDTEFVSTTCLYVGL